MGVCALGAEEMGQEVVLRRRSGIRALGPGRIAGRSLIRWNRKPCLLTAAAKLFQVTEGKGKQRQRSSGEQSEEPVGTRKATVSVTVSSPVLSLPSPRLLLRLLRSSLTVFPASREGRDGFVVDAPPYGYHPGDF